MTESERTLLLRDINKDRIKDGKEPVHSIKDLDDEKQENLQKDLDKDESKMK